MAKHNQKEEVQTIDASDVAEVKVAALSPEDQKKADEKAAKVAEKNAARARAIAFLKENAEQMGTLTTDFMLFLGAPTRTARATAGTPTLNSTGAMRKLFIEKGKLTEMEIFKNFRIGQPEMRIKMRFFVQHAAKPEERIYVRFTPATKPEDEGIYTLVGQGAAIPEGWDGWKPEAASL